MFVSLNFGFPDRFILPILAKERPQVGWADIWQGDAGRPASPRAACSPRGACALWVLPETFHVSV